MSSPESSAGQSGNLPRIRVNIPQQRLDLERPDGTVASYPISTSRFGIGSEPGSYRTPTGRFEIAEMIGGGHAPWTVFKSRIPTGEIAAPGGEEDGVLTRILWLSGLDPQNANTRERYIYIHGTNQESKIGTAASHGCVRMRNADVIELFAQVQPGTPVEIVA